MKLSFSIIEFNHDVGKKGIFSGNVKDRNKAKRIVQGLRAGGSTDINEALMEGINVAEESKRSKEMKTKNLSPMIVFLTDGRPEWGERNKAKIVSNVEARNTERIPILTLGFGKYAVFTLLRTISALTDSLSRRIFEGVKAQDQLENFFHKVQRPTLSNVTFQYLGDVEHESLSKLYQGQMYSGGQNVIVGQTSNQTDDRTYVKAIMTAASRDGVVTTGITWEQDIFVTEK